MKDITKQSYSEWLERALQEVVKLDPQDICIACISKNGESYYVNVFSNFVPNKFMFAGMIQQDAMIDALESNGYINDINEETEDNKEES